MYENDFNSVLLYRCRSNTLKLKWRNRFAMKDEKCDLCGGFEVETLEHFLLDCVSLGEVRRRRGMQGIPVEEVLLFEVWDGRCISDFRNYIGELWNWRKELMS